MIVGPWTRGGAHPDAAVSIVVVVDGMSDRWEEKRRIEQVLWRYSVRRDALVTAIPVSPDDLELPLAPQLAAALRTGVAIE